MGRDFRKLAYHLVIYLLYWIFIFQIARVCFIIYNYCEFEIASLAEVLIIMKSGLLLDVSFSAYLTFLGSFLYLIVLMIYPTIAKKTIKIYTCMLLFFTSIVLAIDLALYTHWGFRIDSTVFSYFDTPKLLLASSSTWFILRHITFSILFFIFSYWLYTSKINIEKVKRRKFLASSNALVFSCLLIIPMRGGLQTIPINISAAYHSDKQINNHAAINPFWNLMHSTIKAQSKEKPYNFMSEDLLLKTINRNKVSSKIDMIDIKSEPNILIIVWESLTSKITKEYGDTLTTPYLNKLMEESIYFNNYYANGTRSDKGLVSIFSGYYPQATHSIMKETAKSKTLPSIFEHLKTKNYKTSFYYGGDMNFGSMNSYFLENGVDEIIDGSHFDAEDKNSKWGAYDHLVFEKLSADLNQETGKFCKAIFTITSHEPFEIPIPYQFGSKTETAKFKSAHYYTDTAIKNFIEQSKKEKWWDNTLVIIMADHGHPLPRIEKVNVEPDRFRIPMIWTGGASNSLNTTITKISSQVDFSKTLLTQIGIDAKDFHFSANIFDTNNDGYAHYIFTNGFGTLSDEGFIVHDMDSNKIIYSVGEANTKDSLELLGKAITQHAFNDYLAR